ncbi:Glyoxylate/hydroxypyruvate reductase B [compost metagenome]
MRKIVSVYKISNEQLESIAQTAPDWHVINGNDCANLANELVEAEIVLGYCDEVLTNCLQLKSKLKWLQCIGSGVDNVPIATLSNRNIIITTTRGIHASPVAETIFAMILSLTRHLHLSIRNQMAQKWLTTGELGEVNGKTLGIIGVGSIGLEVARIGKSFGMEVIGLRNSGQPSPYVDRMYGIDGLGELLIHSDYIVNILPLNKNTRHIIGSAQFRLMKNTAIYINVGRGMTTNTEAMIVALQKGEIAAVGLDVFETDQLPPDSPLWLMENVIITPYNAGLSNQHDQRVVNIFNQNLESYILTGNPRMNIINSKMK